MNADRLLALYERISEAPDAIARLRRFVLDLAVRGKLVEQDPADEPASQLLERIKQRKSEILQETGMRKPRKVADMNPDEIWADLPANWAWTQISDLGFISPRNEADDDAEASFVPMPMISAEYGVANEHEVRTWGEIKKGYTHFAEGDVGLAKITPCFENGKSTVFRNLTGGFGSGTTELHILRPVLVDPDYVVLFLKSPQFIETGIPKMTGTAGQKRVSSEYFTSSPFPLPPLAEQHRIVAKVDALMALCDRLEEARKTREETRDKFTAATLSRLTAPEAASALETETDDTNAPTGATPNQAGSDNAAISYPSGTASGQPSDFRTHARFAIETLPALTSRPDQIKSLRQTILNLAVRGKLVKQDPADEPASVALKAIAVARDADSTQKSKRARGLPTNFDAGAFELPTGWERVCLSDVAISMRYGTSRKCGADASLVPVLRIPNVSSGRVTLDDMKFGPLSEKEHADLALAPGDLLMIRSNGSLDIVGRSAVVNAEAEGMAFAGYLVRLRTAIEHLNSDYVWLAMNSQSVRDQIERPIRSAVGLKNVNLTEFGNLSFWLPPLAEQHRIVAKVDELMKLCDRLEAALTTADTTRTRLLEALLHEALEPASETMEAAE